MATCPRQLIKSSPHPALLHIFYVFLRKLPNMWIRYTKRHLGISHRKGELEREWNYFI